MVPERSSFDAVGCETTLNRMHKTLYDQFCAHPWLGRFFEDVDQEMIERQQTSFMSKALGGPNDYRGKSSKKNRSSG